MRATRTDKREAMRLAGEIEQYARRGVSIAARVGYNAMRRTLAMYERGDPELFEEFGRVFRGAVEPLAGSLLVAYLLGELAGVRRAEAILGPRGLSLRRAGFDASRTIHAGALRFLKRELKLGPERLRELHGRFEADALRLLGKAGDGAQEKVLAAMNRAAKRGMHVKEAKKELTKAFLAAGITPKHEGHLEAIFRTEMQTMYGAGRWQAMQHPAIQQILWGFRYVTVGDDRVRPEHAAMDGMTAPRNDPIWRTHFPPNGWNCRCQAIELFEPEEIVIPEGEVEVMGPAGRPIVVRPGPDRGFAVNPGELAATMGVRAEWN